MPFVAWAFAAEDAKCLICLLVSLPKPRLVMTSAMHHKLLRKLALVSGK